MKPPKFLLRAFTAIIIPGVEALRFFKLHCELLRDFEKNDLQPNGERFESPRLRMPESFQ